MSAERSMTALLVSAGIAAAARRIRPPAIDGWERSNYRGRSVSLSGGLGAAIGAVAGTALAGPLRAPALYAGTSALLAGGYDDLLAPRVERGSDKGLAGHIQALRAGRLSGGTVKVALIGTGSLLAARALTVRNGSRRSTLVSAALIAGSANLLNLFDLRPGRAGKVVVLAGAVAATAGGFSGPMASAVGATAATLPGDLAEDTMLGDLGANTLGALIGVRLAAASRPVRTLALVAVLGLTAASERISFTQLIASTPALRWFDEFGRLAVGPVSPAAPTPSAQSAQPTP